MALVISLLFSGSDEALAAELYDLGTCGIIEEADGLRAFFVQEPAMPDWLTARVLQRQVEAAPAAFSRANWDGVPAGDTFFIAPSWVKKTPWGRRRITIDSPAAFGTGRHETTQMALEWLESTRLKGQTVIDVGCGSGVLSEAARLLGARRVIACDIDELAIDSARQFPVAVFLGSADSIRSSSAEILLVNISAKVIDVLAPELKRIASPTAKIVLTGFVRERVPQSFAARKVIEKGDWLCWTGSRDSFRVNDAAPHSVMTHTTNWW